MFDKLKRRWRRFLFYRQVHHPVFFRVVDFCKFPAQVAVLAVSLWALVGWYINVMEKSPVLDSNKPATTSGASENPALAAARESSDNLLQDNNASATRLESLDTTVIMRGNSKDSDPDSQAVTTTALQAVAVEAPASITLSKAGPAPVLSDPVAQPQTPAAVKPAARRTPVVGAEWVLSQNRGFVVQIATSTRPDRLRAMAQQFGEIEPVAVYPFSVSATGQRLYGLSVGYYRSFLAASEDFKLMPQEIQANEPWIRSAKTLQKAIQSVMASDDTSLAGNSEKTE